MAWAEKNLPEGFAVFELPEAHRVRMRTTNGLERLNKAFNRPRVWPLFSAQGNQGDSPRRRFQAAEATYRTQPPTLERTPG